MTPQKNSTALEAAIEHHTAGRLTAAEAIYRGLLAENPENADALHLLGAALHQQGHSEVAVALIEEAIELNASNPLSHNNLGEAYRELDRLDDAERAYRRAIALNPGYAEAHSNLGIALMSARRLDEAYASLRRALELNPRLQPARVNLALLELLRGDYDRGLALYESRYEGAQDRQIGPARQMLAALKEKPRWAGDDLAGRRVLVWTEQGLGDSVMMLRYLPLLKPRGAGRVTVSCDPPLLRLVQQVCGVDRAISRDAPLRTEDYDCHVPLMSLPHLFRTQLGTVPGVLPYVTVPTEVRERWAQKLVNVPEPRVGLVWAGGGRDRLEQRRSMRLRDLMPLLDVTGARCVSLQKDGGRAELAEARFDIFDPMDECDDLLDTAALIAELDLVVSVDTSVAHLAGALGKPVWLLARFDSAWQWLTDRDDSPWYPTMRIFRQARTGDWHDVIARVSAALAERFPATSARDGFARQFLSKIRGTFNS